MYKKGDLIIDYWYSQGVIILIEDYEDGVRYTQGYYIDHRNRIAITGFPLDYFIKHDNRNLTPSYKDVFKALFIMDVFIMDDFSYMKSLLNWLKGTV